MQSLLVRRRPYLPASCTRVVRFTRPFLGPENVTTGATSCSSRNLSTSNSTTTPEEHKRQKQELKEEREQLRQQAAALTRSLYRLCMRSVRIIRLGNAHDEKDFQQREQDRLAPKKKDVRLSMLSMLPPVDRKDELRSRAEYYMQYTRENFVQESDCLVTDDWKKDHVSRYLFHLKRGDEHRKWLLMDMQFTDEYQHSFDMEGADQFEERAFAHVQKIQDQIEATLRPELRQHFRQESEEKTNSYTNNSATAADDDDDGFFNDNDDDDDTPPEWYSRKP